MHHGSKLVSVVLAFSLALGCGDGSPTSSASGGAGGTGNGGAGGAGGSDEPPEVSAAIALCYETLHGDVARRNEALAALEAAAKAHPDGARVHLFFGMCSLAALAEDGDLSALTHIESELARAVELAPEDRRIPGWLATVKVQTALQLGDETGLESAIEEMIVAADLYPEFNNVSLAIAFASLPLDTPYPEMARARLAAIEDCGETDEKCRDNIAAPHNIPGSLMLFGDVHARVGDEARARSYYEAALAADSVATWPYRAEAQAMLDDLTARVSTWSDADETNDPAFFLSAGRTCTGCHE